MAEELHALLHNAGIPPPYILVGHSMGGYNVRVFASLYRTEVGGMVLVDASHPDQEKRFPPALNDLNKTWVREQEFLAYSMPFGIPRLLGFCDADPVIRSADCNFHSANEGLTELKAFSESASQAATTGSLGNLPLVVLSHDPDMPMPDIPADLESPSTTNGSKCRMNWLTSPLAARMWLRRRADTIFRLIGRSWSSKQCATLSIRRARVRLRRKQT